MPSLIAAAFDKPVTEIALKVATQRIIHGYGKGDAA